MTDAYRLTGPCRRPKDKIVLNPMDSVGGFKGRASWLAEALGGRWSRQAGGYVLSQPAARKFEILYAAGFNARDRWPGEPATFYRESLFSERLSAGEALKLAAAG